MWWCAKSALIGFLPLVADCRACGGRCPNAVCNGHHGGAGAETIPVLVHSGLYPAGTGLRKYNRSLQIQRGIAPAVWYGLAECLVLPAVDVHQGYLVLRRRRDPMFVRNLDVASRCLPLALFGVFGAGDHGRNLCRSNCAGTRIRRGLGKSPAIDVSASLSAW